jgi:hypothetical protein
MPRRHSRSRHDASADAVILVDYSNLFGVISERSRSNDQPDHLVLDLIRELRRHTSDHLQLNATRTIAFANLPPGMNRGHRATGAWLSQGIEPRFSYAQGTDEATTIDLAMEAMEIAGYSAEPRAFIILSGNQWFVPLVQRLQRAGHFVLMASLESPSRSDHLPADVVDSFLNARFLLSRGDGGSNGVRSVLSDETRERDAREHQKPVEISSIDDDGCLRTLEIIETYFGQYEEVYLTPLLRKLSDELEPDHDEPKTIINVLEEAGAIWLEKRRGFPHNYTVLLVNGDHPDVNDVKESMRSSSSDSYDDFYRDGEDDYDDYDDSDEDFEEEDDYPVESGYEDPRD